MFINDFSRDCFERESDGFNENIALPVYDDLPGDMGSVPGFGAADVNVLFKNLHGDDLTEGDLLEGASLIDLLDDCSIHSIESYNQGNTAVSAQTLNPVNPGVINASGAPSLFGSRQFNEIQCDNTFLPEPHVNTGRGLCVTPLTGPATATAGGDSALQNFLRSKRKSMAKGSLGSRSTNSISSLDLSALSLKKNISNPRLGLTNSNEYATAPNASWNVSGISDGRINPLLDVFGSNANNNIARDGLTFKRGSLVRRVKSGQNLMCMGTSSSDRLKRTNSGHNIMKKSTTGHTGLRKNLSSQNLKKQSSGKNLLARDNSTGSLQALLNESGALYKVPTRRSVLSTKYRLGGRPRSSTDLTSMLFVQAPTNVVA